jgi:F0F1-type ATP synthase membrane subunit c/vacuolar-type H+-ATPase subunit K
MRQVFLVRIALILGVSVFAAFTAVQRMQGMIPDATDPATLRTLQTIRYAGWAYSAFALAWAFFFRARVESAMNEPQIRTALLVGWAPAEAAALLGVVQYFLGAPLAAMAVGLLTFAVVLLLLPIPDTRG